MLLPFARYRLPAILYAIALFWASSLSRLPLPKLGLQFQDKLIHVVAYAIFSYLIYRALFRPHPLIARVHVWAAGLGLLYAISDEVHQMFVPGRSPELWDLVADAVGIVGVQLVIWWWRRRQTG